MSSRRPRRSMRNGHSSPAAAVIGAGGWGTALAWLLAGCGHEVRLWARSAEQAEAIVRDRENTLRLRGARLPDSVIATCDLGDALGGAGYVIMAVPSAHVRDVASRMAQHVPADALLISVTKGLEPDTGMRMSEVLREETGVDGDRVLALSGPNLSGEIVAGMPAVSVIAGTEGAAVEQCQCFLATPLFRIYANYDILGVEICGALKNVIAIAAGVSDGLGYGANAKAALVTRGLAEIARVGTKLGALRGTFWGLAGVGDLLATCNSRLSRNWQVGSRLGQGESIDEITRTQAGVAEGIPTTAAARELAGRVGVEAPITLAVEDVVFRGVPPDRAVEQLMARRWRVEAEDWH